MDQDEEKKRLRRSDALNTKHDLNERMSLLEKELNFIAARSRGPGGQNVNKVSSAAQCFWEYQSSNVLSEDEKNLIREKLSALINLRGEIFLRSDEFRDLVRNKRACVDKLKKHLQRAFFKEKPRKPSRPTKASIIKKREKKKKRGELKNFRRKIIYQTSS
jgi:ribosome-associated protein